MRILTLGTFKLSPCSIPNAKERVRNGKRKMGPAAGHDSDEESPKCDAWPLDIRRATGARSRLGWRRR